MSAPVPLEHLKIMGGTKVLLFFLEGYQVQLNLFVMDKATKTAATDLIDAEEKFKDPFYFPSLE